MLSKNLHGPVFRYIIAMFSSVALLLSVGCGDSAPAIDRSQVKKIDWLQMIPAGFSARDITRRYDVGGLGGQDPERQQKVALMRSEWSNAPVDESLDGQLVELSGYVVPLADGALKFAEFLLVPFAGACIHVPPPPSNQVVYVRFSSRIYIENLDEPYRVIGTLRTQNSVSDLASAGYTLDAVLVERYPSS